MPEETTELIVSFCFNDKNLAPDVQLLTKGANVYNLESRQLIDSAFMRNLMGDDAEEDFIFEDGFYPRLRDGIESEERISASPILLYPGENADSVSMPFYVDTNYGVRWRSKNEGIIRIEGNVGYVRHPVLKETTVRVEAWKGFYDKHVYLTVPASNFVYQDLMADTVCPGDSVKMINSYAKNEGWNYEVVETTSVGNDTIFRMYLHHYPTYCEVVHRASVERDSLPYILGKDTIRNFGLTELHRYQTVHGCDSVIYVRLDTLYIHRARHFYDTLHTCEGGTLSWRGREITQTGDYTDTVFDPYKGGTDSIYHLRADIYPKYQDTFIDSCYIEELPYTVGGRLMQSFGEQTERYVTVEGCDSVYTYVLAPRWHPSQVHGVVTIEGDGVVCMQENTFQGAGTYVFEVEKHTDLHFRIKPGKQFYLDSLLIAGGESPISVSRDSIFAERDDTLHYYWPLTVTADTLRFVFKEVRPWERGVAVPYKSRDKSYAQIYRPEELYDPNPSSVASLQNDIDLTNYPVENNKGTDFENIEGNNKIIKHVSGNHFYKVSTIKNVHFLDNVYGYPFMRFNKTSLESFTAQGVVNQFNSDNKTDDPFFVSNFINFCTTYENGKSWMTINKSCKNIINWGRFDMPFIQVDAEETASVSYVFNFGSIPRLLSASNGTAQPIVSPCFNDKNLAPQTQMPTQGAVYNLESRQLIDSAFMRSLMGESAEEDFIFEDGFYPRLRHMDERVGRLAASPILLYPGENSGNVSLPFYVDTNYGVRWRSLNEKIIKIEGNVGYVCYPVQKRTTVQVEAWKEDFSKSVYLTVPVSNFVYKDLLSDTVCPGDSVKMIHSYAKNEGWNYEVMETTSVGNDTIFRMYLHHYPTYHEVHRAAVERDSLPYIYGKDTIRNFGLTELHRYQTVHGCDSVLYVQLDTLYVHREQHFYDILHTCEGGVLSWRGREITQTGDYADTVFDPYKGGTDSIYHLRADIYPVYHLTFEDSCYIEELPYEVGGKVFTSFGEYTEILVTGAGCDSVREYSLSRRWRHYRVSVEVKGEGSVNVTDTVLREDASLWFSFSASPCYRLDSLRIDGRAVPPQNRYFLQNLHGDCEVEAVFGVAAPEVSVLRYEACADSLPIIHNGETYGAGEHEIVLRNAAGCDSVVRIHVEGLENTARIAVLDTIAPPCNTSEIAFSYRTEAGAPKWLRLAFDPVAQSAGFRDTTMAIGSTGGQTVRIALPLSVLPDRYGLQLWQADGTGCYAEEEALNFEIPYPSDIIVQKWNDVLAVLSSEYNGGYEFSGYQWYKNGEPMEGEMRPYIYVKPYLRSTDTYAVLLERASDGLKLQTCGVKRKSYPQGFSLELAPNPTVSGEAVQVSVNGKPDAEGTIEVFDGTGKPVYQRAFNRSHTLRLSVQPGSYVVRVRNAKNTWTATGKLLVR